MRKPGTRVDARPSNEQESGGSQEADGFSAFMTGKGYITIGPHDKVRGKNKNPERMMFNPDMVIATFADPDNNYFQLVTPWEN